MLKKKMAGKIAAAFCLLALFAPQAALAATPKVGNAPVKQGTSKDKKAGTAAKKTAYKKGTAPDTVTKKAVSKWEANPGAVELPPAPGYPPLGKIVAHPGSAILIGKYGYLLPAHYQWYAIMGKAMATKNQAAQFIASVNPHIPTGISVGRMVDLYWEEAGSEGIRPDIALCQALVETAFFRFGNDVKYWQHNFCGLGANGGGVKGAVFRDDREGVRAHIQHLLAYSTPELPKTQIVDPKYRIASAIRREKGLITRWQGLNNTWAMNPLYAELILTRHQQMLQMPDTPPQQMWHEDKELIKETEKICERYLKKEEKAEKKAKQAADKAAKKAKKTRK